MAKASPIGLAMIAIVWIFVTQESKREQQRIENAKERAIEQRAYDMQVQNMWANNIKAIIEKVDGGQKMIADALNEHERASRERYEKMGITDDLLKYAKENLRSRK